jgi:hypothetical protein
MIVGHCEGNLGQDLRPFVASHGDLQRLKARRSSVCDRRLSFLERGAAWSVWALVCLGAVKSLSVSPFEDPATFWKMKGSFHHLKVWMH